MNETIKIDKTETENAILGGLMDNPTFLQQIDKYTLTPTDFASRLQRDIFIAIYSLSSTQPSGIRPEDIDSYLRTNESSYLNFKNSNGPDLLNSCWTHFKKESFETYYHRLKKYNLLIDLQESGFNIAEFCSEDSSFKLVPRIEEFEIEDIIAQYRKKLLCVEGDYSKTDEVESQSLADGIDQLVDNFGSSDEVGLPIQGRILNQVINGAAKGTLTIRSAGSGVAKTRSHVGDACYAAYPIRFNPAENEWEAVGAANRVLLIVTEQSIPQIQRMVLAYLSGINESRFKINKFNAEERARLETAKWLMKEYAENFQIVKCPNPTIELLKQIIREKCLLYSIDIVFYDYIFIGPSLLGEFRGFNLRNDELLLLLATALKDLAVELNVAIFTSTQVNAAADQNRGIRNEATLAGGRSTINKADNGLIMARPTDEELMQLQALQAVGYRMPNLVTDVYKVRSGEWSQVRIWSIVNLGILRREDIGITDTQFNPLKDFFLEPFLEVVNYDDQEYEYIKRETEKLNVEFKSVNRQS